MGLRSRGQILVVAFSLGAWLCAAPTRVWASPCTGDCDVNGKVLIDELLTGINIALGNEQASVCPSFDQNNNGIVTIDEILAAVSKALEGCEPEFAQAASGMSSSTLIQVSFRSSKAGFAAAGRIHSSHLIPRKQAQ